MGDAAHLMAPFGARGLNSSVADVENLAWKLAFVLKYGAPDSLLDSYDTERWPAQRHNQMVTNTTMLFMSPPNRLRRIIRNLVLRLSAFSKTARRWVNSGKMVEPFIYKESSLLTIDDSPAETWQDAPPLGSKVPDVPCICWSGKEYKPVFLRSLLGSGFVVLYFTALPDEGKPYSQITCSSLPGLPVRVITIVAQPSRQPLQEMHLVDESGALQKVFAAYPGTFYLIRPDGHISARRRSARPSDLPVMLCRACGLSQKKLGVSYERES